MNKYRNLQNCLDGASVIMDVVEEFELEGDFKAIACSINSSISRGLRIVL
jgi:hypothetical protein